MQKALILDYVRENLRNDYRKLQEGKICSSSSFWDSGVLDLVELVLRPPDGGPPSLPGQSDAVLNQSFSVYLSHFSFFYLSMLSFISYEVLVVLFLFDHLESCNK